MQNHLKDILQELTERGVQMNEEEYRKFIRSLPDDAFDGHTEFHRLTPEQKLMWLSQIAQFVVEARSWRKVRREDSRSRADAKASDASD